MGTPLCRASNGMVAALADAEAHMAELEAEEHAAIERFRATTVTSELGAAAMRAAARRYGRRPGGRAGDEAALMGSEETAPSWRSFEMRRVPFGSGGTRCVSQAKPVLIRAWP